MPIRHSVRPKYSPTPVTARRLAAANRALKRERDRLLLFADEVAQEQESAEERIARIDEAFLAYEQRHRDLAARQWRRGRRMLQRVRAEVRDLLITEWNRSRVPADAAYFADFVWTRLKRLGFEPDDLEQ